MLVLLPMLGVTAPAHAQTMEAGPDVTAAAYAAILRSLSSSVERRAVLVDPRTSATFHAEDGGSNAIDVWEAHLSDDATSPGIERLTRNLPALRVCRETPTRSDCLRPGWTVHVTFSHAFQTDSTLAVDVTLATRIGGSDAFGIQTWRYHLKADGDAMSTASRDLLVSGHGRLSPRPSN